ncbi:MAG: phosphate acyltransferase, partial [Cardiobacterium sp.]
DCALIEQLRQEAFPDNRLQGMANLLIMPNIDAGNISLNLLKAATDATMIGPMLIGVDAPVHVLSNNATTRRIINMAAIAVVEAQTSKNQTH